jgi:myo-inositol 2-dehydrogenase/D-chiro-inositol 1-dehydrogenase
VRFGVIGAGLMGRLHAENLASRVPGAKLVAVADIHRDVAASCAAALGVDQTYESHEALLAGADVDAVAICTPPDSHAEIIIAAAASGKHVFCEKPLAADIDAAAGALKAARGRGVKVQLGFNRRFDHRFRQAQEAIQSGAVGDVYMVHTVSRDPVRRAAEVPRFAPEMFLDTTIHDLDMVRFVTGREVLTVMAVGHPAQSASPRNAVMLLTLEGGAMATIENSWLSAEGYDQRLEVYGSKGVATVANEDEASNQELVAQPFFVQRYFDAYIAEMTAFVECIVRDEGPLVTGEDGLEALRLAHACRRSYREGRPVALSEIS